MVQGNKNPRIRIAVVDGDAMVEEEFSEIQWALTSSGAFTYVNRATVRNLPRWSLVCMHVNASRGGLRALALPTWNCRARHGRRAC